MKLKFGKELLIVFTSVVLSTFTGGPGYDMVKGEEVAFARTPEAPHLTWQIEYSVDVLRLSQDNPGIPTIPYWDRQPATDTLTSDRWPSMATILKHIELDTLTQRDIYIIDVIPL